MTPRTSFKPAHFPSADQRNRSYDRRRSVARFSVRGVGVFALMLCRLSPGGMRGLSEMPLT